MHYGLFDLTILILIFILLQFWWIIPLLKKSKQLNIKKHDLNQRIKFLENIYKK